jgi:Abnormal spindle-like microcephaly-assoc'd, ASPM-SPD-2-Hydin
MIGILCPLAGAESVANGVSMDKHVSRCQLMMMVVVIALLLVSAGCGGNSRPSATTTTQASTGQLSVKPASIAFGSVTVNTTTSQNIQLSNSGGSSVTVSSASTSGPGFHLAGLAAPMTLASGQNVTFSAMFSPSSAGAASGSVQITATGMTSPLTISLSGTGVNSASAPPPHNVALSWLPSTSTVIGYNVYRANQSGGPYAQTNSSLVAGTTFSDSSVAAGQIYWYVVTAVAAGGIESLHSNEAMAAIPTP